MFDRYGRGALNRILTVLSAVIVLRWGWEYFNTDQDVLRRSNEEFAARTGLSASRSLWIGIAVVSAGYLFWRFMVYIFWRKYFKDE
ncbi:MAG: hypothetical protein Q4F74_01175 [Synergistaceae bacterium]|nr:hypothetical protein [Synergistaceae bacterium]